MASSGTVSQYHVLVLDVCTEPEEVKRESNRRQKSGSLGRSYGAP